MSSDDVFCYPDTNSSRAGIDHINAKFLGLKIGVIGIGGTGSYILDHLAKTSVSEIHIYDGDDYEVHNSFRAPGATARDEFGKPGLTKKVGYFHSLFSKMHRGITPHDIYVTSDNVHALKGLDYVFVSVDQVEVRKFLCDVLKSFGIPTIDCGMGIDKLDDSLIGTIRVTTCTGIKSDHLNERFGEGKRDDNLYASNIQVSELNCLTAILAVIKWKKLVGFYQDLKNEHNSLYFVNTGKLLNEDFPT